MKAKKGKTGCLKPNGRLKKGFRWAKSRKGECVKAKSAPKKAAGKKKSTRKSAKRVAAGKKAAATRKAKSAMKAAARFDTAYPVERTREPERIDVSKFTSEELKSFGGMRRRR